MPANNTDARKQRLLAALRECRGIVSTACASAGVARRTFYHWLDEDEDFLRSVEDVQEEAVDYVESKLMDRIEEGKERSIIFYLKTRGKRRGFQENGTSDNLMLSRDMVAMFHRAYSGKGSRFDFATEDPGPDDYAAADEFFGASQHG